MPLRDAMALLILTTLGGCAWISDDEYLATWDQDGDGWGVAEEDGAAPGTYDCDDSDASIYPYAEDTRGDGIDSDCGAEADADGDDWPDAADCDDEDPDVYPCSPLESSGDGVDSDCDGLDGQRDDECDASDPGYRS